jgi:hypothetical protein
LDGSGFTWDIGGHVLFSHYPYFDEVVNEALKGYDIFGRAGAHPQYLSLSVSEQYSPSS